MPQQHADLLDQSGQTVESTGDQSPGPDKAFQIDCHDKGSRQDQTGTPQGIADALLCHTNLHSADDSFRRRNRESNFKFDSAIRAAL